jgi:hypothetical protein
VAVRKVEIDVLFQPNRQFLDDELYLSAQSRRYPIQLGLQFYFQSQHQIVEFIDLFVELFAALLDHPFVLNALVNQTEALLQTLHIASIKYYRDV